MMAVISLQTIRVSVNSYDEDLDTLKILRFRQTDGLIATDGLGRLSSPASIPSRMALAE